MKIEELIDAAQKLLNLTGHPLVTIREIGKDLRAWDEARSDLEFILNSIRNDPSMGGLIQRDPHV